MHLILVYCVTNLPCSLLQTQDTSCLGKKTQPTPKKIK